MYWWKTFFNNKKNGTHIYIHFAPIIICIKGIVSVSIDKIQLGNSWEMRLMSKKILSARAIIRAKVPSEKNVNKKINKKIRIIKTYSLYNKGKSG